MSLDVTLTRKRLISYDNGKTHTEDNETLFESNITHNLTEMADKANIYEALWRPYKLSNGYIKTEKADWQYEAECETATIIKAKDISPIIQKGLDDMKARPNFFKTFDDSNEWGTYVQFIPFIEEYLEALTDYPEAIVKTDR